MSIRPIIYIVYNFKWIGTYCYFVCSAAIRRFLLPRLTAALHKVYDSDRPAIVGAAPAPAAWKAATLAITPRQLVGPVGRPRPCNRAGKSRLRRLLAPRRDTGTAGRP